MIFLGEIGFLFDFRKFNLGKLLGQYDLFFEKLGEIIEEYIVVDDRRYNIFYMLEILIIKDLINQIEV